MNLYDTIILGVMGRGRSPRLNDDRALVAHMLRQRGYSLREICRWMDGRDKSTVSVISQRGSTLDPDPHLEAALDRWLFPSGQSGPPLVMHTNENTNDPSNDLVGFPGFAGDAQQPVEEAILIF